MRMNYCYYYYAITTGARALNKLAWTAAFSAAPALPRVKKRDAPRRASKPFVDAASALVQGGDGGRGSLALAKRGGSGMSPPDGGNGGKGGGVYVEAAAGVRDLSGITALYQAGKGGHGGGDGMYGRRAKDVVIQVPLGTWAEVYRVDDDGDKSWDDAGGDVDFEVSQSAHATFEVPVLTLDLSTAGERHLVAAGGVGGLGSRSKGSRHRSRIALNTMPGFLRDKQLDPEDSVRQAAMGGAGESVRLSLRLKTLADIGLVGAPNAGKSSLLRAISTARPAVADYPFTTISPMVGSVVCPPDGAMLSVADVPGLLRGASMGKGMGIDFLRHVERAPFLAFVVDVCADPHEVVEWLLTELAAYDESLVSRPRLVVANKVDLPEGRERARVLREGLPSEEVIAVSALTGEGMGELIRTMRRMLESQVVDWKARDYDPVALAKKKLM